MEGSVLLSPSSLAVILSGIWDHCLFQVHGSCLLYPDNFVSSNGKASAYVPDQTSLGWKKQVTSFHPRARLARSEN
ncbi:hypothetical protein GQ457_15G025140 [Hibiscus cannabinus]